jgi:hypothetical protein
VVLQHAIRPATAALLAEAHTLQLAQQLVEEGAQVLSLLGYSYKSTNTDT